MKGKARQQAADSYFSTHKQEAKRPTSKWQKSLSSPNLSPVTHFLHQGQPPKPPQTVLQTGDQVLKSLRMGEAHLVQGTIDAPCSPLHLSLTHTRRCSTPARSGFVLLGFQQFGVSVFHLSSPCVCLLLFNACPSGSGRFQF